MILYYAMGGGLGHLSRSLAILQELPHSLVARIRVLASSRHAPLAMPSFPCPVDRVPEELLTLRQAYLHYLENYLEQHRISAIILDTFPFGIVGEWLEIGLSIPRLLIARSLKWEAYQERIRHRDGLFPQHALVIEMLPEEYARKLERESQVFRIDAPITLLTKDAVQTNRPQRQGGLIVNTTDSGLEALSGETPPPAPSLRKRGGEEPPFSSQEKGLGDEFFLKPTTLGLIVHSGDRHERETLERIARAQLHNKNKQFTPPDRIFPDRGIYPAEEIIARYKTIVAAAGYNMVAIASQAPPDQHFILHPFPRRFDDQFLRLQRFQQRQWPWRQGRGSAHAARWLAGILQQRH